MGAVEAFRALRMVENIAVPGAVDEPPLVDAPDGLAQPEKHLVRQQPQGENDPVIFPGQGEKRNFAGFGRQGLHDRAGGNRAAEGVFADHGGCSLFFSR